MGISDDRKEMHADDEDIGTEGSKEMQLLLEAEREPTMKLQALR